MTETSHPKRPRPGQFARWPIEPTVIAMFLAAALCVGFSAIRYDHQVVDGMQPDAFWAMKADWRNHEADIVIAGDSRVLTAVSTEAMQTYFPNRRVINFAFLGVGYGKDYLQAARAALNTDGPSPTIVLGISPRSFTVGACEQKWFGPAYKQHFLQRKLYQNAGDVLWATRPIDHADLMTSLGLAQPPAKQNVLHYHPDGWQSATSNKPHRDALDEYRAKFAPVKTGGEGPVSQEVIDAFMLTVAAWRAEGIAVMAFRTPSCPEMLVVEAEHSGFDEASFVRQFRAAGGTWLTVDQAAYASYDGSHLAVDDAPVFSADLAKLMLDH
jgi:hypothetical protein